MKNLRLHEELAWRERVLRETQLRSIHEVGELKRAQEMWTDESSRNESRESKFQDTESICSGKLSHVPSQPAVVP